DDSKYKLMKHVIVFTVIVFSLVLVSPHASAQRLNYYGINAEIENNLVTMMKITMIPGTAINQLEYNPEFRIYNLTVDTQTGTSRCDFENAVRTSSISCDFYDMQENRTTITMTFYTRDVVKRIEDTYEFRTSFPVVLPADRMFTIIKLPPKAVLSEDIVNQSYFPSGGDILTDGRSIILTWEEKDLDTADKPSFSVLFEIVGGGGIFWDLTVIIMTSIVVIIMISIGIYMKRTSGRDIKTEVKVLPLLNKDEKRIVDILAREDGEARQNMLVKESDYSKAKVSRLIKNLKERGVVDTEPISGRENKVILKIKGVD
ncbi:MAG: helix-turn-helix domain-containing protein, partial [Candidatus Aenigmatarchaeota archaeon]